MTYTVFGRTLNLAQSTIRSHYFHEVKLIAAVQVHRSARKVRRLIACWSRASQIRVGVPERHRVSYHKPRSRPSKWPSSSFSVNCNQITHIAIACTVNMNL